MDEKYNIIFFNANFFLMNTWEMHSDDVGFWTSKIGNTSNKVYNNKIST